MNNSWPNGKKLALSQDEHRAWNAGNYPGTRQMCESCLGETERCEEDALFVRDVGPLCSECFNWMLGKEP